MKTYESLYKQYKTQNKVLVFAHFYPSLGDFDEPYRQLANQTLERIDAWEFTQPRFKDKHPALYKLKNYLNYTFIRLLELEQKEPGKYFKYSPKEDWISFNTGLQNSHGSDLLAVFQKYQEKPGSPPANATPDWVYKGCFTPSDYGFRNPLGTDIPEIAYYSNDSKDFVFDTSYSIDKDVFGHLFDRAKERAGLPHANDEAVRNYLRGALENLIPKIKRNYKIAIPVYYVEEKRMQLLLPFFSANNANEISCFLVERDDTNKAYKLKTIFDLDQAYIAARLITRPDGEWLNP